MGQFRSPVAEVLGKRKFTTRVRGSTINSPVHGKGAKKINKSIGTIKKELFKNYPKPSNCSMLPIVGIAGIYPSEAFLAVVLGLCKETASLRHPHVFELLGTHQTLKHSEMLWSISHVFLAFLKKLLHKPNPLPVSTPPGTALVEHSLAPLSLRAFPRTAGPLATPKVSSIS